MIERQLYKRDACIERLFDVFQSNCVPWFLHDRAGDRLGRTDRK